MNTENNTSFANIWIADEIVHVEFTCEHYTEAMVDEAIKQRLEITKDGIYPMLSNLQNFKSATKGAKQRIIQNDAAFGTKAVAVLINSKVQEVIYNFFILFYKAPTPIKMFTNKEKALEWLKQYKTT